MLNQEFQILKNDSKSNFIGWNYYYKLTYILLLINKINILIKIVLL
ncbi:hypothetical protein MCEGE10_01525 [Flavobacteriaceae bacterium]